MSAGKKTRSSGDPLSAENIRPFGLQHEAEGLANMAANDQPGLFLPYQCPDRF